jgi:H+/Cl- antiporter ClcA
VQQPLAGGEADNDEGKRPVEDPEVALIIVACGVGLATGASIVVFNDAIHFLRDVIWQSDGGEAISGRELLRELSELELWPRVVFPPVLGGLFVGLLAALLGGFDGSSTAVGTGRASSTSRSSNGSSRSSSGSSSVADAPQPASIATPATQQPRPWPAVGASKGSLAERVRDVARPVARAVAAAITLGTGASLGPEGPSVDIGRSWAGALGSLLRNRERHLVSLIAAGSGAGVAAGFNAPIAGVFFAVETVLQRQALRPGAAAAAAAQAAAQAAVAAAAAALPQQEQLQAQAQGQAARLVAAQLEEAAQQAQQDSVGLTVPMVLLASVVAAVVSQAGLGSSPAFTVPEYRWRLNWVCVLFEGGGHGRGCSLQSQSCPQYT